MDFLSEKLSLVDILKRRSKYQPNQVAFYYLQDGEKISEILTYKTLHEEAIKIASALHSLNFKNNYCAILLYESGTDFVKAFFGCLYAGIIAVPTYIPKSKQSMQKTEYIAHDCNAQILLTTQKFINENSELLNNSTLVNLMILATDNLFDMHSLKYRDYRCNYQDIAFLQYTSGSTSQPKGVMVTHKNIIINELMLQQAFALTEKTIGVSWLPLFHDMGLIASLLSAISFGYPVYIMPPSAFIRKPFRWLECISRFRGTYTCAPNFAYDLCVEKIAPETIENIDLSCLKTVVNAAEPIRYSTLENFSNIFSRYGFQKDVFTPGYGLAEATVCVSGKTGRTLVYSNLDAALLQKNKIAYQSSPLASKTIVNCGATHYLGQQVKIVNSDTCVECKKDEIGEIWITGDHIAAGYFNKPELTTSTFRAKLNNMPNASFLRTGDLGFLNELGDLYITGRIKDLIIIHGRNYYPQDIESTIENTDLALRKNCSAAFEIEIQQTKQLIVVVEVRRKSLPTFNSEKLGSQINAMLLASNELTAYEIVFVAAGTLQKTTSGKIQRQLCKTQYLNNQLNTLGRWNYIKQVEAKLKNSPVNVEEVMFTSKLDVKIKLINCMIFWIANTRKMPIQQLSSMSLISDFNLDSIQMVELSNELEKIIGFTISEKILYEHPTIQDVATALIHLQTSNKSTAAEIKISVANTDAQPERKIVFPKFISRQPQRNPEMIKD